jgi:hypothetical protein
MPRPLRVDVSDQGAPTRVYWPYRRTAEPLDVESVTDCWRIDDEWWRPNPISRRYYRVVLSNGRMTDLYLDLITGEWYHQHYGS